MKTNIIKALFGLILTFFISGLYAQSPRIKLNQIVKDTVSGSVLISNLADSNMVYSRNFYIGSDTSLVFFGTTIVAGGGGGGSFVTLPQLTDSLALYATKVQLSDSMATVLKQVATDLTLTGDGTGASPLKVDTAVIATVSALRDSLAGIISSVSTDVTLTGDGSVGNPLKVDTTTYIATKGDLNLYYLASNPNGYTSDTGTVTSVAATAGTGISISGSPITGAGTLTITNTAPDQTVSITGVGINAVSGTYPNFTITGTEVDGSTTNELQTISYNSGTNTLSLSDGGGTADLSILALVDSTRINATGDTALYYQNGVLIGTGAIAGGGGGSGTVTSVDVSGGTTGLTTSGGPVTTSGTITITGTLDVDNGGTGATSFTEGQMLKGNGTSAIQAASNLREDVDTVYVDKFLNVDTNTFFINPTNNRIGINTNNPKYGVEYIANGYTSFGDLKKSFVLTNEDLNYNSFVLALNSKTRNANFGLLKNDTARFVMSYDTRGFVGFLNYKHSIFDFQLRLQDNGSFEFYDPGEISSSLRFQVKANGEIFMPEVYNTNTSGARDVQINSDGKLVATSSSINTKDIVGNYNKGINWIKKLNPVYYTYKKDDRKLIQAGFIAEEFDVIGLNEFVGYSLEGKADGINYSQLTTLTVKAIQEQQAIIESQANEIEQLKTQIQLILNEIEQIKNK